MPSTLPRRAPWILLVALLLAAPGPRFALGEDACPYCGQTYGSGPSRDSAYLARIRAAHEATCSARGGGGTVYVDDLGVNVSVVRWMQTEAQRNLAEVNRLMGRLTAGGRILLASLPPEERSSLEDALDALMRRYRGALARNQALQRDVDRLERQLSNLEGQVGHAEDENHRLLRDIDTQRRDLETLTRQLAETNRTLLESEQGRVTLESLETGHTTLAETARKEYWRALATFFRGRDLGTPRDFIPPIRPRSPRTSRGTKVVDTRLRLDLSREVAAVPAAQAVVVERAHAIPVLPAAPISAGKLSVEDFQQILDSLNRQQQRHDRLVTRGRTLLVESDVARRRLADGIAAGRLHDAARTRLTDTVERVRNQLDWALWKLDVRTRRGRAMARRAGDAYLQGQKWSALKDVLGFVLRDPSLTRTAHAELHLAVDLINGDLGEVVDGLRGIDRPEARELVDRLTHLSEIRGGEFIENLLEIESSPVPGTSWVAQVLKSVYPAEEVVGVSR